MMLLIVRLFLSAKKEKCEFCMRVVVLPLEAERNVQVMLLGLTGGWALLIVNWMVKVSPHNCMLHVSVTTATRGATTDKNEETTRLRKDKTSQ